ERRVDAGEPEQRLHLPQTLNEHDPFDHLPGGRRRGDCACREVTARPLQIAGQQLPLRRSQVAAAVAVLALRAIALYRREERAVVEIAEGAQLAAPAKELKIGDALNSVEIAAVGVDALEQLVLMARYRERRLAHREPGVRRSQQHR